MTFIEVVAAVGLLGVVAASLMGVLGFVGGSQAREAQQLAFPAQWDPKLGIHVT